MQLERERLALVELEIMNVRLRRNLQVLTVDDLLKRLLNERLDHLLAYRVLETLLHELRWRLSWAEAGKPDAGRITARRLLLRLTNGFDRHLNLEKPLDPIALFRRDPN